MENYCLRVNNDQANEKYHPDGTGSSPSSNPAQLGAMSHDVPGMAFVNEPS